MERVSDLTRGARRIAGASAAILAAYALAGGPALAVASALSDAASGEVAAPGFDAAKPFDRQFEDYAELPAPPAPDGNVVDLTAFEPPVEIDRKPVDRKPAGRITRSLGTGVASYYGRRFHGRRTANGERFNMNAMTAAHKTLPFGTKVRVTNPRNGKSVTVRINDRGPYIRGRTIDLSRAAASKLGIIQHGHGRVKLDIVS